MLDAKTIMPSRATHPGEVLADELEARGMTQVAAAQKIGVSQPMLSQVIKKKKGVSIALALKLEAGLGIPADFWLNLQKRHDHVVEYHRKRRELEKLKVPSAKAQTLLALYTVT